MSIPKTRPIVVDDVDSRIQYVGQGWALDQGSLDNVGNFGPVYLHTSHGTKINGSLSFSFKGSYVRVTGTNTATNSSTGVLDPSWDCFVDGTSIGPTKFFPFAENNWLLCEKDLGADGSHVLTVNATARGQNTFWVDSIVYRPPASASTENEVVWVDSLDPDVQAAFGTGWGSLGGSANMTTVSGAEFRFNFTGVGLSWVGFVPTELSHKPSSGSYSLDGGPPTTFRLAGLPDSGTTTVYNQFFFTTPRVSQGTHEVLVTYLGTPDQTPLTLDYLLISNGTTPKSNSTGDGGGKASNGGNGTSSGSGAAQQTESKGAPVGAVVGGVVGGVVLLSALALLFFLWWRKRRTKDGLIYMPAAGVAGGGARYEDTVTPYPAPHRPVLSPLREAAPYDPYGTYGPRSAGTGSASGANSSYRYPAHGAHPSMSTLDYGTTVTSTGTMTTTTEGGGRAPAMMTYLGAGAGNVTGKHQVSPSSATSTDSTAPRTVQHEDSGLRLREGQVSVIDVPPTYTPD